MRRGWVFPGIAGDPFTPRESAGTDQAIPLPVKDQTRTGVCQGTLFHSRSVTGNRERTLAAVEESTNLLLVFAYCGLRFAFHT